MSKTKEPTPRQADVLVFIAAFTTEKGYPPTVREIARAIGVASTQGAADHLRLLKLKGLITSDPKTARSIQVVSQALVAPLSIVERRAAAEERAWVHDRALAEEGRVELLTILRDQHTAARTGVPPCACCRIVLPRWQQLYRCFHCDLWLCPMCARRHFGKGPRGSSVKKRAAR